MEWCEIAFVMPLIVASVGMFITLLSCVIVGARSDRGGKDDED